MFKRNFLQTSSYLGLALLCAPAQADLLQGNDQNNTNNAFIQPQANNESGGGRDQTQRFGDNIVGTAGDDVLIGALGIDGLFGGSGDDVIVGGTEDFNPENRDRAFGGSGDDVFAWAPGDGSDFFDGQAGNGDTLMLGLIGEGAPNSTPTFTVQNDQNHDPVFIDPQTNRPIVNASNSPGFCEVTDRSSSTTAATELEQLGLTHLVRFFIRAIADDFAAGNQTTDNGLRVTIHLTNTEFLVCTDRQGGAPEVLDLRTSPPSKISLSELPNAIAAMIR